MGHRLLALPPLLLLLLLPLFAGCVGVPDPGVQGTMGLYLDPTHRIQKPVHSWQALKERAIVMQQYDYSCGAASLATVAKYYWGDPVTEDIFLDAILARLSDAEFEERKRNGLAMTDLKYAAIKLGYLASMGRLTMAQLLESRIPLVVRIIVDDHEHFVVYRGVRDDRVFLADPIRGHVRLSVHEFAKQWTDGGILVVVKPGVKPPEVTPLTLLPSDLPAQHEMQAARRSILLQHTLPRR